MEVAKASVKPTPIPADDSDVYETHATESELKASGNVNVISEADSGDGLDNSNSPKMSRNESSNKLTLSNPVTADATDSASAESTTTSPRYQQSLPTLLVPSLKGKMLYQGGAVTCRGLWGMSDEAHELPGQTSDFEFKLVQKSSDEGQSTRLFPVDGKYQGWFFMKQAPPLKGLKVDDKDMMMQFHDAEENSSCSSSSSSGHSYRIEGNGWNKFGKFNLRGTLSEEGVLHMYREYYDLTSAAAAPSSSSRRKSGQTPRAATAAATSAGSSSSGIAKRTSFSTAPTVDTSDAALLASSSADSADSSQQQLVSPREGSGRVRKQSFAMMEYQESKTPRSSSSSSSAAADDSGSKHNSKQAGKQLNLTRQDSSGGNSNNSSGGATSERAQRLTGPMKKCLEVLREMSKHPQGMWFLEPVDYVSLNLPDYPKIIKQPMDFATVRSKIETAKYETPDNFAEDMRLVFRNAMEFNYQTDSAVHIAAKEMAARFEERFRVLATQLGGISTYSAAVAAAAFASSSSAAGGGEGQLSKMARNSSAASVSSGNRNGNNKRSSKANRGSMSRSSSVSGSSGFIVPAGPRPGFTAPPVSVMTATSSSSSATAGMDANALTIAEMQRMMLAMQEEISTLRATVKQQEIVGRLYESKEAAQYPLTIDEKRALIEEIHQLPAHKLESVIEIIQSSLGGKLLTEEIPLDTLDTLTMRKLQKFIEENNEKKRRSSMQRQSNKVSGVKRQRKWRVDPSTGAEAAQDAATAASTALGDLGSDLPDDAAAMFESDELLFPDDSFEDAVSEAVSSNSIADAEVAAGITGSATADVAAASSSSAAATVATAAAEDRPVMMDDEEDFAALASPGRK